MERVTLLGSRWFAISTISSKPIPGPALLSINSTNSLRSTCSVSGCELSTADTEVNETAWERGEEAHLMGRVSIKVFLLQRLSL